MTNNKQQTAVEWFLDQLIEHRIIIVDKTTYQVKYKHEILLEQAKEMHREEHFNTWWHSISENEPITFEQYYNETYGGTEQ
jgi:hypothetical protein